MSQFWPPAEPSQHAYERLRAAVLAGGPPPDDMAAARFARRGLADLIARADVEPLFSVHLVGATRAAWTPYADPRLAVLAATYRLLLGAGQDDLPRSERDGLLREGSADHYGHAGARRPRR